MNVVTNTPIYSAQRNTSTRKLQNGGQSGNPSFGFKPIENNGKGFKFFKMLDDDFNSAWQRFVSGATAILTQPFFDRNNKNVDEDTRITSTARTISKIVVGTATGVGIRALCIKVIGNFTKNNATEAELARKAAEKGKIHNIQKTFKNREQCLLSKEAKNATYRQIKKYRGAIGTFVALGIMLFTNFLIDAPLTMKLTNIIAPKMKQKFGKPNQKSLEGGKNVSG